MKKDGEWIATLSTDLKVNQLIVEANPLLGLVELTEVDRLTGRPSSVRFFDPVEGSRLRKALKVSLAELDATDHPRPSVTGP